MHPMDRLGLGGLTSSRLVPHCKTLTAGWMELCPEKSPKD